MNDIVNAEPIGKSVSHKTYPSVIYCWAFHDGARDAASRILIRRTSGEYSSRQFVWDRIKTYESLADDAEDEGRYWDAAYIIGYLAPLMIMTNDDPQFRKEHDVDLLSSALRYFVYGTDHPIKTADEFKVAIKQSRRRAPKERKAAKEFVKDLPEGMIIEHEPFLHGLPTENDSIPDEHSGD